MSYLAQYIVYIYFLIQFTSSQLTLCPADVPFESKKGAQKWLDGWAKRFGNFWSGHPQFTDEMDIWGDCIDFSDFEADIDEQVLHLDEAQKKGNYIRSKTDTTKFKGVTCNVADDKMEYPTRTIIANCNGELDMPTPIVHNDNFIKFAAERTFIFNEDGYITKHIIKEKNGAIGAVLKYFIPDDFSNHKPTFQFGKYSVDTFDIMLLLIVSSVAFIIILLLLYVVHKINSIYNGMVKKSKLVHQYDEVNSTDRD